MKELKIEFETEISNVLMTSATSKSLPIALVMRSVFTLIDENHKQQTSPILQSMECW